MSSDGIRTKLGYRICDWVGNTVVEPLPHPHASSWTINGMQAAAPGSVAVGNFTIPLYPPRSYEYMRYKGIYDKIKPGMRVEAYIANDDGEYMKGGAPPAHIPLSSDKVGGLPVFSGIIHKINRVLDKFELVGFDSLWLGQQTTMYPGMSYTNTGGGTILNSFTDIDNLSLADDFNGSQFPTPITWSTISGSGWSGVQINDETGWQNSSAGENILATTIASNPLALLSSSQSGDVVVISAWFHVDNPPTTSGEVDAEIIYVSDNTGANLFMARAKLSATGSGYNILAELFHKTAGVYSNDASVSAFTGLTGNRKIQLIIIITPTATNGWFVRLLVNGKDTNCTTTYTPSSPYNLSNRYWGSRFSLNAGTPTVFFSRFYVKARLGNYYTDTSLTQVPVQAFTGNDGPLGSNSFNLTSMNGLTLLDIWSLGSTLENFIWRKDPIRLIPRSLGLAHPITDPSNKNGDVIAWGVQTTDVGAGLDLSQTITLDEEINIISGGAIGNAESLGTEVRLGFDSSPDNDGVIFWPDIKGMLAIGQGGLNDLSAASPGKAPLVLIDPVSATGLHDMSIARRMADVSGARKALTLSGSKQFTILRDENIAAPRSYSYTSPRTGLISAGCSLNAFKELDFITLNVPSIGIDNETVSVQSYTFRENDPTMDVTLNQFSFGNKLLSDRRRYSSLEIVFQTLSQRA